MMSSMLTRVPSLTRVPNLGVLTTICRHKGTRSGRPVIGADNVVSSPFSDVTIPDVNLSQYVWGQETRKQLPALTCAVSGRSYTFSEAEACSQRLSVSLPDATGLKAGDVLGLILPNLPEFAVITLAAAAVGIVVSPANPNYTPEELARQLGDCGAKAVVTTPELLPKVRSAVELTPGGMQVLLVGDPALVGDELNVHELMARQPARTSPRLAAADPSSLVVLPYSSGTTGLPKGVRLTHRNLVANLCQMAHPDMLPVLCLEGGQNVALAVLPFYHIYGLTGVMSINLCFGRHTVCMPKFEHGLFASCLQTYQPTVMSLVPPLVMLIASSPLITVESVSSLRGINCGAAPATKPVLEKFLRKVNNSQLDFKEGFGMTETSCMALCPPPGMSMSKLGSCGQPVPLTQLKVVDEQTGRALPLGEEGEMLVRGPQMMQGYHNNEAATRATITEDGWLRTGDVAKVDSEGFVFIVDRMKELIKVNGLQVSPTELEGVIRQLEGVADVAVVGVDDARAGEVPRAFIVRGSGASLSESDVHSFMEPKVAAFKRLAGGVTFVQEIPKTASGKILRKVLKTLP